MADWQVGDLALCVDDTANPFYGSLPIRRGSINTVENVIVVDEGMGINLVGIGTGHARAFNAGRFVKVTPPAADAFDRETIELMQRKPVEA